MIDEPTRAFLDQYFRKVALVERVEILALSLLRTHVHLLLRSGPTVDLSKIVRLLKGGSSFAASRQPDNVLGLRWNKEYSVTTVSPRMLSKALEYLRHQDQRHPSEPIPR
jgi:REP element-mobilizing transposase RayT